MGGEGHLGRACFQACVQTWAFTWSENTREGFEQRQGGLIWDQEYHPPPPAVWRGGCYGVPVREGDGLCTKGDRGGGK